MIKVNQIMRLRLGGQSESFDTVKERRHGFEVKGEKLKCAGEGFFTPSCRHMDLAAVGGGESWCNSGIKEAFR